MEDQVMKLRLAIGAVLLGVLGSAYGGTFTSLAILSSTVNGSSTYDWNGASGIYSGTANVNAIIPHASLTASAQVGSSPLGSVGAYATAQASVSARFEIHWKQTTLGEALPTTLYHHHEVAEVTGALVSANAAAIATGRAGLVQSTISGGGPMSDADSGTQPITGSLTPSWIYVSTDISGLSTYRANNLYITSPTASAEVYAMLMGPGGGSAMASGALDDNFYFSTSSTP
jgi:hypothetical protein